LDLAGNDYLGLASDPRVVAAAAEAARVWGAGATASRLVTGTTQAHADLEAALAAFCGHESALVFSSGYLANLGVVAALGGRDALVVSDAHVHASLVDACRLSRARVEVVPHLDLAALDTVLADRREQRALVLTESVFSVLGDAPPLGDLAALCARHGAVLVVDEAHGLGVVGEGGRGLVHAAGLAGRPDVLVTATLSKALGSQGGAVLGPRVVRDHLVNHARPFVYDTALAPAAVAGAAAALAVLADEPERPEAARACASALAEAVGVPAPAGAVLSVPMPGPYEAVAAAEACGEAGVRVGCFRPPSVPDGVSRLRVTARATLVGEALRQACAVLSRAVARDAG
ncbi:MAG: 8-amino-7-oxononanoate synthase, partial [Actinomycetes bacterium]